MGLTSNPLSAMNRKSVTFALWLPKQFRASANSHSIRDWARLMPARGHENNTMRGRERNLVVTAECKQTRHHIEWERRGGKNEAENKCCLLYGKGKTRVRRLKQIGQVFAGARYSFLSLAHGRNLWCGRAETKMIHGPSAVFMSRKNGLRTNEKCCKLNKNRLSDL